MYIIVYVSNGWALGLGFRDLGFIVPDLGSGFGALSSADGLGVFSETATHEPQTALVPSS